MDEKLCAAHDSIGQDFACPLLIPLSLAFARQLSQRESLKMRCLRRNIGQDFACPAPVGTFVRQKYPKPPGKRDGKSRRFPRTPPRYVQRTQDALVLLFPNRIRHRACGAIRQSGRARTGSGGAAPLRRGPPAAFGDFWGAKSHNWVQGGYKPCLIICAKHTSFSPSPSACGCHLSQRARQKALF